MESKGGAKRNISRSKYQTKAQKNKEAKKRLSKDFIRRNYYLLKGISTRKK